MNRWLYCISAGTIGGILTFLFGGWDASIITLITFMVADYITGTIVAALNKSPKSESGALQSKIGWKGLAKKAMTLVFVFVGVRLDITLETDYIRDTICIGFIANELLSLIENAGLMGLPLPKVVKKAVEVLKSKDGENDDN